MIDKNKWKRVMTSKKYLQGPFSGYFNTQWPDFKVLSSKFETKSVPEKGTWSKYPASGMRFLLDEDMHSFDFKRVEMSKREDGVPIHSLTTNENEIAYYLESFCNPGTTTPNIFNFFKITNTSNIEKKGVIGLITRSGEENYLTGMEVDGYCSYNSNVANWGFLQNTWSYDGEKTLTDNEYVIEFVENSGFKLVYQDGKPGHKWHQRHLLRMEYDLKPNQSAYAYINYHPVDLAENIGLYENEKIRCENFYLHELKRIKHMPDCKEYEDVVNNLVIQCLQFFNSFLDEGYIAPRQGGMNRMAWAAEAVEFVCALDRIGDFNDYTTTACDYFFNHCQDQSGEIKLRSGWASTTGAAVRTCAYHIIRTNESEYLKYKDQLYKAFKWMETMRAYSYESDCVGKGIFAAAKGNDWPGVFQSWCVSDGHNLLGYKFLKEAFEKYNDPNYEEVANAYEDYMNNMKRILKEEYAKNTSKDEFLVSNRLGLKQTDPPMGAYFGDGPAMLLMAEVMDPNSEECHKAEQYYINRGCFSNGLTGLMNDGFLRPSRISDPWAGHVWYLSTCDSRWFNCYLNQGNREKAKDVLDATLYYGMSNEYYLPERFCDNDETFMPWQPNASANGRLIMMLSDFYGNR